MLKRFFIAAIILLAACQSAAPPIATPTVAPTPSATPLHTGTMPPAPKWMETQMNGVSLGLWRPAGWAADSSHGLVMAEPTDSTSPNVTGGLLIYCFVPSVDEFYVSATDVNYAWSVLDQVIRMPSHVGHDVAVSLPVGFDWDQVPAAYYLLTSGDGMRVLVVAVMVPNVQKVVVCNMSVPAAQASRIRSSLAPLLNGLTVNGKVFSGKALDALPNPLLFPHYSMTSTPVDNRISASSPP
jgi:hypothetical protein